MSVPLIVSGADVPKKLSAHAVVVTVVDGVMVAVSNNEVSNSDNDDVKPLFLFSPISVFSILFSSPA
jgi:hypothetical protein